MSRTQLRLTVILLFVGAVAPFWWFFPTFSADLMAVWLAGHFLASGQPDQVYAPVTEFFQMYPPDAWRPLMASEYDFDGPIYPFLYPPIWAKLAGLLSGMNFWVLTVWALLINCFLQVATIWLVLKIVRPQRIAPPLFVLLGFVYLYGTHIGTISLQQNQPQILVSFLLVLAIERSHAKADLTAGAVLALAASIKLYPALFAVYWLVSGNRRALSAFALLGGGLGLASVIWSGWPLHAQFLEQIRLISASVLTTAITFNLDATLAQLFFWDDLVRVPGLEPPTEAVPDPGWYSMARPGWWKLMSPIVLFGGFLFTVFTYARSDHDTRHMAVWPLGLTMVAILSPLTWVYYFIPAAAFAPILLERLGIVRGGILWVVPLALVFGPFVRFWRMTEEIGVGAVYTYQWAGFTAFAILCYGFWQAGRTPRL